MYKYDSCFDEINFYVSRLSTTSLLFSFVQRSPNISSSSFGNMEDMHHKSSSSTSSSHHNHQQNQNHHQQRENRPPVYNAEDYVAGLKRFCKLTGLQLYLNNNSANNQNGHENINGNVGNYLNENSHQTNYQNGDYSNDTKQNNLNGGSSVSSNNKKNKKQKNQNYSQNNGSINGFENGNHNLNGNYNGSSDNLNIIGNGHPMSNSLGNGDMVRSNCNIRYMKSVDEICANTSLLYLITTLYFIL